MSILIKSNSRFEGGAFVLNNNCKTNISFSKPTEIFLTNENSKSLRNEILKLILDAKDVLKICSFIITDKRIYEAILERAKERKIAIFILTQLDSKKLNN